jgi:FkbM family methyltransferase
MLIKLDQIVKDFNLHIRGVLHVGAHYGEECADYINQGIMDMILFEPIKSNFKELIHRMPVGAKAVNIALGNETGTSRMYVETANNGQSCSLLEPKLHLEQYPDIKFCIEETVAIEKLDNIEFDRMLFNMINIDVQGFELEVFKGAVKTLPFVDIIYTEVNFNEVYKGCCLVDELDRFLGEFGFKRTLTDDSPKSWGDALYLKQ